MGAEVIVAFVCEWLKTLTYALAAVTILLAFVTGALLIHIHRHT